MSQYREEKQIVEQLSNGMLTKLAQNRHKPYWRWGADTNQKLLALLKEEVEELQAALQQGRLEDIYTECCDVANYAAMIADIALEKLRLSNK